jgi:DNA-binding MarR family transcriptional regulator
MRTTDPATIARLRADLTRLTRRLRQVARNDPESWTRMLIVSAIDRLGPDATPSALARAETMRSSNLAAVLRDLERAGMVVRAPDTRDRRKTRILLTPAGRDSLMRSRDRRDAWLAGAMSACLDEEERERLLAAAPLLARLAACPFPEKGA